MDEVIKSYLAGCIDCDGYFSIKRSTYNMRIHKDAGQPVYSERIGLKQVTQDVPKLLHEYFGGSYYIEKPSARHGKPLYAWTVTDRQAFNCAITFLPYLRVKKEHAKLLIELRRLKNLPRKVVGTVAIRNRWGTITIVPRRIVAPEVMRQKDLLFDEMHSLNCITNNNPTLLI